MNIHLVIPVDNRVFIYSNYCQVRYCSMKTLCIINPIAGRGRAYRSYQRIRPHMAVIYPQYKAEFTQGEGHAASLAREAAERETDLVITMGGDGTVHEVINGLAGTNTALAVLPSGTGNDYARNLKIPQDPLKALHVLHKGSRQRIDLGILNSTYFINMAGLGFDAAVARQVNKGKYFNGTPAYLAAIGKTLVSYQSIEIELTIDGHTLNETITMIAVANGEHVGGGIRMVPGAEMADGLLDVCVVKEASPWEILKTLPLLYKGGHLKHPKCSFYRGRDIIIKPLDPRQKSWVQVDGEVIQGQPLYFGISPQALTILKP